MEEKVKQKIEKKVKKRNFKPKFSKEDLGINPLIQDLVVDRRKMTSKKNYIEIDSCKREDGIITEVNNSSMQETSFYVEQDKATKVYTKSDLRLHIMTLSTRAKELYLWLIYELEKNEDYVWINVDRYMEECDISSSTTYQNTVKDLHKFGVICPTVVKDVYWINPLFFFNGSRIEKYPTKVKTK